MSGPGPIPNRWLHCPRKSDQLIAEKFLAFKTPLSMKFKDQMPLECIFTPEMIFSYTKTVKLKLGLWIDLTNTKRFYDRDSIENKGAQYFKLQCRGHGETPSREQTSSFIEIVENFINDRPFDIIGVHCTHGFNRTGFLIVSYMVEKLDCSVEAALGAFAQSRPPGIYKEDYIRELYRRYDDEEDAPLPPDMPDWCFEFDDSENGNSTAASAVVKDYPRKRHYDNSVPISSTSSSSSSNVVGGPATSNQNDDEDDAVVNGNGEDDNYDDSNTPDETGNSHPTKKKRKREILRKDATFMIGVSGVNLITDQPRLGELQAKVQDMCEWKSTGFPGSQPVSMDQQNLHNLGNKPYQVSWKADGTRYMMLINCKDEIYFFDRDNSCFQVDNLTFPRLKNLNEHITDTLLDGEMVIDVVNGTNIPRYLVYDIIKFGNEDVGKLSFHPNRVDCIKKEIIRPRHEAIGRGIINRNAESFSVRHKEFWEITQARALLSPKFAKNLCHKPDGLIFQPALEPYTPGQSPEVLKWKPLNMNSVDFKLMISEETGIGILNRKIGLLYVGGLDVPFSNIKYTKALKDLNNKIIECAYENNQWVFMRHRTDKLFPNSYKTAMAVWNSIKEPVTTELLLDFIQRYRFIADNEIMPPPAQPHQHHGGGPTRNR